MKIEVNIEDYLTEEEIKEIIQATIKTEAKRNLEKEYGIGNTSYYLVGSCVDQLLDEEDKKAIKEKTKAVIADLGAYSVFKEKDILNKRVSLAQKYLNEAVENNKELINQKVIEIIEEITNNYKLNKNLKEEIENGICETIIDNLFIDKKSDCSNS